MMVGCCCGKRDGTCGECKWAVEPYLVTLGIDDDAERLPIAWKAQLWGMASAGYSQTLNQPSSSEIRVWKSGVN